MKTPITEVHLPVCLTVSGKLVTQGYLIAQGVALRKEKCPVRLYWQTGHLLGKPGSNGSCRHLPLLGSFLPPPQVRLLCPYPHQSGGHREIPQSLQPNKQRSTWRRAKVSKSLLHTHPPLGLPCPVAAHKVPPSEPGHCVWEQKLQPHWHRNPGEQGSRWNYPFQFVSLVFNCRQNSQACTKLPTVRDKRLF